MMKHWSKLLHIKTFTHMRSSGTEILALACLIRTSI